MTLNLQNYTLQYEVYIIIFIYMYTYKHIILYTLKSSFILTSLLMNTLLNLNLICLVVELKTWLSSNVSIY